MKDREPPHPDRTPEGSRAKTPPAASPTGPSVLRLQAGAGNRAVSRMLVQRKGWTNPLISFKSDSELVKDALEQNDTEPIKHLSNYGAVAHEDKLKLIDMLNREDSVWGRDALAMQYFWGSFDNLQDVADADGGARWELSLKKVPTLTDVIPQATALRDRFPADIRVVVEQILDGNKVFVESELRDLGIAPDGAAAAPMNDGQRDAMSELQAAAKRLGRLQLAQELGRKIHVGWRRDDTSGQPAVAAQSGDGQMGPPRDINAQVWSPAEFDPFQEPPFKTAPPHAPPLILVAPATIHPYAEVKEKYDAVSTQIADILGEHPALYGVARDGSSGATNAFAKEADPAKARATLGTGLKKVIADIDRTRANLGGSLDVLDLVPVHSRMLKEGVTAPGSPTHWDRPTAASIARQQVRGHEFARAVQAMAIERVSQAAMLLAPLAGPAAMFVMLAGVTIEGLKTLDSTRRFDALSTAAKATARKGTELTSPATVDDAEKEKNADQAALALTVLVMAAGEAVAKLGISAPESRLMEAARTEARRLIEAARAEESGVTSALEGAATKNNAKLTGKSHMFKTEESLTRKLHDRARLLESSAGDPEGAVKQVSAKVNDVLRYTVEAPPETYTAARKQVYADLQGAGNKLEWDWDAWKDPKTPYRGYNSTWRSGNGQLFEVQFHTAESYLMKSSPEVRAMYEEARAASTTPARRAELEKLMYEKYGLVPTPDGVEVNKP